MTSRESSAFFPAVGLLAVLMSAMTVARADDACMDFKWDVTHERALFAGTADSLAAGADVKSAPSLLPDRLYELRLLPQDQVSFAAMPGRKTAVADAYAGVVALKIPKEGSYRVAIDAPFWIDVVWQGSLVPARDFQGQHGCSSPHKIVEFDLVGTQALILQVSNATPQSVRLTITPTPLRKL